MEMGLSPSATVDFNGRFWEDEVMNDLKKSLYIKKRPHKDETLWGDFFRW
jgi:hypothetical protein